MKHNGYFSFLGIDISKDWFDLAIIKSGSPDKYTTGQFTYTKDGFVAFLKFLADNLVLLTSETLVCMEDTGIYCNQLLNFLKSYDLHIWVEMPLRINKSSGIERGTNDQLAAIKIATYSYRYSDKVKLYAYESQEVKDIAILNSLRKRLQKALNALKVPAQEFEDTNQLIATKLIDDMQKKSIKALEADIKKVEELIAKKIKANQALTRKEKIIISFKGAGPVTARYLIACTNGFTKFANYKQLATYASVAPFGKSSGTSIKIKGRVSKCGDRKLNSLLRMCAISASV